MSDPLETYKASLARFNELRERNVVTEADEAEYVAAGEELLRSAGAFFGSGGALAEVKRMVYAAEAARAVAGSDR